jgi:uncharacterized damage-inducible protein DinB
VNFENLFLYDDWANREEVRHLRSLAAPPAKAVTILAHIAGTQWLWLGRLRSDPKPAVVWPDWDLDRCEEELARLYHQWKSVLPVADLHAVVEYVNSKGERWSSRTEDILIHSVFHGAYHRGQIATLVRGSGQTPAYTDYIHCIRQGLI